MLEKRKRATFAVWIVILVVFVAATSAPADAGRRVALVVGNAAYEHALHWPRP